MSFDCSNPTWQATVTPCQLVAWLVEHPRFHALAAGHLRRVAQTDSDYAAGCANAQVRAIAADRAADLSADADRIDAGLEPQTFTGRLNACEVACSFVGLSSNNHADLFERGGLMPPANA